MPRIIKSYVRIIGAVNHRIGRMATNKAGKPYRY